MILTCSSSSESTALRISCAMCALTLPGKCPVVIDAPGEAGGSLAFSRKMIHTSSRISPWSNDTVREHAEVEIREPVLDVLREIVGEEDREITFIGKVRLSALR
jgi:hypothetical protein